MIMTCRNSLYYEKQLRYDSKPECIARQDGRLVVLGAINFY